MMLSENIKAFRKQKKLRQEQLAEAMGVSTASVSKWETGQCAPELTVLLELADFFEVSIDTLVGHTLNSDRIDSLIVQAKKATDNRNEEMAASICMKILRNYPNNDRAVEACADCYYKLFIHTDNQIYMEQCITQTKRLMSLKQGEPEKDRLERIHYLANQYGLLHQWDTAKEYYMKSNVSGINKAAIAECMLRQGNTEKAVTMVSDALIQSVFHDFQAINILADGWIAVEQQEKACSALEWMYGVMDSLHYNPTTILLLLVKLSGLYRDLEQEEKAKDAFRKAAELVRKNSKQEFFAEANFLQIEEAREMLTSIPEGNRALLIGIAENMGCSFTEIVDEVLQ